MTPSDPPTAPPGLPPVTPPSGRFIAQLFLVPGMIVLIAVLIILGINYLFIGGYTPQYFLSKLDSDNHDIRWRGASDLAQHIKRPESKLLKSNVGFALDLADRLRVALDDLAQQEQLHAAHIAKLPAAEHEKEWQKLSARRDYREYCDLVEYLSAALGDFYVPAGVPLLCEIINREDAPDVKGNTMRRRRAIWALSNLGANLRAIDQQLTAAQRAQIIDDLKSEMSGAHLKAIGKELTAAQRAKVLEDFKDEISAGDKQRRIRAANGLFYLESSSVAKDTHGLVFVDRELAKCATTKDRYLREHVAMAFNFWDGDRAEETLLRLARDDGFGTLIRIGEGE